MAENLPPLGLGVEARDKVTGFSGIVTSRVDYITGCSQFALQPRYDPEKDLKTALYFDGPRLEVIGEGIPPGAVSETTDPGGPAHVMLQNAQPTK